MKLDTIILARFGRNDEDDVKKDRLFRDYDTVLKESAILTTFDGVLFGFLLNISIRGANQLIYVEKIIVGRGQHHH